MLHGIAKTIKQEHFLSSSDALYKSDNIDQTTPNHDKRGLLDTYKRANSQIQVEVIANKRGVDLLRSNVSAYERRISLMQEKYPNLSFLVCGQTISKLQKEGKSVKLLPHTGVASSAADQINKRLLQGWGYIRI